MNLEPGVPYWLGGGQYIEDRLDASIPEHTTYTLPRAYLLKSEWDPWRTKVVEAVSGKVYRISPEAWYRSLVIVGDVIYKEAMTQHTRDEEEAKRRDYRMTQEW